MSGTTFATVVTRADIPLARVLMDSVARWHPESRRLVVVLDGAQEAVGDARVLRPTDLVDERELLVQQHIYTAVELSAALKAKLLAVALDDADRAFYLDPDMLLFHPVTAAVAALDAAGTVLTPHRVTPPRVADRVLYEWALKAYGVYNTGFVGVTAAARPMLEWWDSRLRRDCLADLDGFAWVDQKVMDLAPSYFDISLFKDPAYTVGWWNLEERRLRRRPDGTGTDRWWIDDAPLVLMHYSGVRPRREPDGLPHLVHSPSNSVVRDTRQMTAIREIERTYVDALLAAGFDEFSALRYGHAQTPGGHRLSVGDRRGYRRLVLAAEARDERPPHPDEMAWGRASRLARRVRMLRSPGALLHDGRRLIGAHDR